MCMENDEIFFENGYVKIESNNSTYIIRYKDISLIKLMGMGDVL